MSLRRTFDRWIGRKFKVDTYVVIDGEIICERYPEKRISIGEIHTWCQVFLCFGVWVIKIQSREGRVLEWSDKHGNLLELLKSVASDKEAPLGFA